MKPKEIKFENAKQLLLDIIHTHTICTCQVPTIIIDFHSKTKQ